MRPLGKTPTPQTPESGTHEHLGSSPTVTTVFSCDIFRGIEQVRNLPEVTESRKWSQDPGKGCLWSTPL